MILHTCQKHPDYPLAEICFCTGTFKAMQQSWKELADEIIGDINAHIKTIQKR